MKIKISHLDIITFMVVISVQLMNVTIGSLKVWEILSLSVFPLYMKKIDKRLLVFFGFFLYLLISSLIITYINDVDYSYFSVLKSKYIITLVRFAELILALVFISACLNVFKNSNVNSYDIIEKYLNFNFVFTFIILLFYLIERAAKFHFLSYGDNFRFKGFYIEGGPFGAFIATLFILEIFTFRNKIRLLIFLLAILFTYSKASYVFIAMSLLIWLFFRIKQFLPYLNPRNKFRFSIFLALVMTFSTVVVYKIGINYVNDVNNISQELSYRSDDNNLVMGRVAATYIGKNIFVNNPFMGVGLGNYSLVRNEPIYRGIFPKVYLWDLSGLGGLLTLLLENGIVGLSFFIIVVLRFFSIKKDLIVFPMLFSFPFLLGCQIYFIYPWFYLCLYLLVKDKKDFHSRFV